MIIHTTRFGKTKVEDEKVLTLPRGLLGLSGSRRYVLLHEESQHLFHWLQSCDEPEVALVVADPKHFFPNYQVQLTVEELDEVELEIKEGDEIEVVVVLVVSSDPKLITANLLAPLVINVTRRQGVQVVLHGSSYNTRHQLFPARAEKENPRHEMPRASGGQP